MVTINQQLVVQSTQRYRNYTSNLVDDMFPTNTDKDTRRQRMLKQMFTAVNEPDIGQDTNNPYILAMQHFKGNAPTDLSIINSVLAYHALSLTQEEFNILKSIVPVSLSYPLPNNDPYIHSVVGPATKRKTDMVPGGYVLTVNDDGRQYVGSSSNLSIRLRVYYNTKSQGSGRTISTVMSNIGPSGFSLMVYVIPFSKFSDISPVTDAYRAKLIVALEQYLILDIKPALNDMLVVNGGQTKNLGEAVGLIQSATSVISKVLYVYSADKDKLLYISPSLTY